ncbi:MAG TPA: prolyl oligopeptidase family serine peptidase [Acidobacteriota bacterium]|nr:prolyl oligopeptidase family serine peptidase [Acidobacteriota bacterium]
MRKLFFLFFLFAIQAEALQTGWLKIQLPELPHPDLQPALLKEPLNPKSEVFEIYIPKNYDVSKSYGVLAWVNPHDGLQIPRHFEPLFDEYGLIAISAERIGNDRPWQRRIAVLESGIVQLSKTLNIDPQKRIMSGLSGGGRTSATACFVHPEFWKGAISWVGGNFYKTYSIPMPVGATKRGINDYDPSTVSDEQLKIAREKVRFVLITGPNDFNLNDSRGIYRALRNDHFQSVLLEEPGLGHEVGSAEYMKKALEFVIKQ